MTARPAGSRPRGAVRSEAARTSVLEATASLFAARGYDHLTIEGIASEAGVAKQTIYRWWTSKSAVVAETLIEGMLLPGHPEVPETGDIRADLSTWLGQLFQFVDEPTHNALVRSLVAAAAENESIGERLNDALGATATLTARIECAREAGELAPEIPVQEVVTALVGAVVVRALRRATTTPDAARQLIGALLH